MREREKRSETCKLKNEKPHAIKQKALLPLLYDVFIIRHIKYRAHTRNAFQQLRKIIKDYLFANKVREKKVEEEF